MLASILIIFFSLLLFIYWFRYTCLLLLNSDTAENHAARIAAVNRLSFPHVQEKLKSEEADLTLDSLHVSLENDYRMLRYLLQHAAGLGIHSVEQRLLIWDYAIMKVWYGVSKKYSQPKARKALEEMSNVLAYLASEMGQRVGHPSEA